jgi:glycosyltransferase involved in cell wall biosynthesis
VEVQLRRPLFAYPPESAWRPLRIAIVAPPWLPVPPLGYGGTEAMIDVLCRGLTAAGHHVLLCASGDSNCPVEVFATLQTAGGTQFMQPSVELGHAIKAYRAALAWQADIVHDHTLIGPLVAERFPHLPVVTTNHGPFDGDLNNLYSLVSSRIPTVAISHDQASRSVGVTIARVIHHGIDLDRFPLGTGQGGYALFLGRITPEKGVLTAINVARALGVPLRLAAKMREPSERRYFTEKVQPLLGGDIEYVGEVDLAEKLELLGDALCLLNPIEWSEPFGLVMIEALATGTPVVAKPVGSAPEIVEEGVSGFLSARPAGLVRGVARSSRLRRADCRGRVESVFTAERMVAEHLCLYREVLQRRPVPAVGGHHR